MANNVRINPITGEADYFYPMEVTSDSDLAYAALNGLEVGWARIGYRRFKAIFVPCKKQTVDSFGRVTFHDTPSDVQRQKYLEYIRDELTEQMHVKENSRCIISDGRGGLMRCPARVKNPDYTPGSGEPKTLPVRCDGCKYEPYHRYCRYCVVHLSEINSEDDEGNPEPFDPVSPRDYYAGDRYLEKRREFVQYVSEQMPKLTRLAALLVDEYTQTEAARELGLSTSTVFSQRKVLERLMAKFLLDII